MTAPHAYAGIESALERALALLRGGAPAASVWRLLTAEADADVDAGDPDSRDRDVSFARALRVVRDHLNEGNDTATALAAVGSAEWRALAACWRVAELSGAPLVPTLERFAVSLRGLARVGARRSVLIASPRSTIRLVISLPPLALVMSWLLGFDPLAVLAGPIGIGAVGVGGLLLAGGTVWASALIRRLERTDWVAGWEFELVAVALAGGIPPDAATRQAVDCADRARAEWVRLSAFAATGPVARVIHQGRTLGAPLRHVLLAEAERSRTHAQSELERAAERFGVAVLVPLAVCVLPAFVLIGVVPVLLSVLGGMSA